MEEEEEEEEDRVLNNLRKETRTGELPALCD